MSETKQRIYVGKVLRKIVTTKDGNEVTIDKLLADNPLPTKKDGSVDPYFKGQLIWRDADGVEYLVKQGIFGGVSDKAAKNGFTRSLAIDLNDTYCVQKLNK